MISDHWRRGNTVRVVSKCLIAIALMTSAFAVGLESAAFATGTGISEVAAFPVSTAGPGATTLTIDPQKLGDLVIFESQLHSTSITVTGVNCPGTGAWTFAQRNVDTTNGVITEEIWWAMATSTGSSTITATYSSSITGLTNELVSDSFTSTSPSVWSYVLGAGNAAASTGAIAFPSVESGAGTNQLYWGYAQSTGTAAVGGTTGFNYALTGAGNLLAYDDAVSPSTPYAPTATESPSTSNNTSIAAIFLATPATAYTVTFDGNGSTGGSMSTETTTIATPLTANAFTRTGYSFSGWNTNANGTGGTAYADGAPYSFTANATLYAQWALTPATLTAVGTFVSNASTGLTTADASLTQAGDLLVIWVKALYVGNPQIHVTSISGSGTGTIGTPVNAIQYYTVQHPNNDDEIWYAPITHSGTITLTFAWSGSNSSDTSQYSTQEFQPSTPSTYSLDTTGHYENSATSLTMQFPSLTPAGAGELYAGYNSNGTVGTFTTPTTTGYTGETLADGDVILFDPDVSASSQSPSTTATSQASTQSSIGALIIATPKTSYTVTFNGNTATGGTMANETDNTSTALTTNAFTKTGYTFSGWNTNANGTGGTAYADGAPYSFTANATLYAQWTTSGSGGGTPALGTLTISAATLAVTVGGTFAPTASVTSGLTPPDTGIVTSVAFTYAGTSSTAYAASTTPPTAVGTYSVTPSSATVSISPSADAANYATTYTYVAGTLVINSKPAPPAPHASRVIGSFIVGQSHVVRIAGSGFSTNSRVTSNEPGATVHVLHASATLIVLWVNVRKGSRPGTHTFTITTASGKTCKIGYISR